MPKLITKDRLEALADRLLGLGVVVAAPVERTGQPIYAVIEAGKQMSWSHGICRNSFKEFLFPQTEVVATFRIEKGRVHMETPSHDYPETVVIGARPCDAASVASLRAVFTWKGDVDPFFVARHDRTTVVTVACAKGDGACFCTSVGLAPDAPKGSDVMLRETLRGNYLVEPLTERGRALVERAADLFLEGEEAIKPMVPPPVIERSDIAKILAWLSDPAHYDDALWSAHAAKCVGCGACTYVCPTCHCFDITDEGRAFSGERRKNWDACQFDHFTLHAGGHNPRDRQSARWRNRFMCKFHFYPTKFDAQGCVGCGRCIRVCYIGLDITEMMERVSQKASGESP